MAPALSLAPEPSDRDTLEHYDKLQCNGRQVLVPVDNLATPEADVMGLPNQPNVKAPQAMEQILVDLSGNDLLQVMKTFENNNDALSTGEPESIFPLDLPEPADSESESLEDRIRQTQVRMERRCAFLLRRLRILQARAIGKRVSEEVAQTFEKCTKGARKDGGGRPMGMKALVKRVETTAALQASAASKSYVGPKNCGASTSKCDASKSATVGIAPGTLSGLEETAGALKSHLAMVKKELDSDATASSSGAESNDEAVPYNNPHQQHKPINKRALWTYQRERASIASRWSWLQAQIQELEYRIRQHNDLHKQVREAKGAVEFEGDPSQPGSSAQSDQPGPSAQPAGYSGSLPGAPAAPAECSDDGGGETCARVRPLRRDTFKKRKLLQMHNLHIATNKAAKASDIKCRCQFPTESCPVCCGRADATLGGPPDCTLTEAQRRARDDPGYHPVLSDIKDVSPWWHLSQATSSGSLRPRRPPPPQQPPPAHAPHTPPAHAKHNKKHHKMKRGRPPLSRKLKERERDEEHSTNERSRGRTSTESRSWRRQSYDIDNIVIPQSVAANTRPQILTYKEIITPKWRVMEIPEVPLNNGISKSNHRLSVDEEEEEQEEDVSDAAVWARHALAETRERTRYPRPRGQRRDTHEHDAQQEPPPPNNAEEQAVRPYSPRVFPLPSPSYSAMVSAMPAGHLPPSPPPASSARSPPASPRSPRSPHSPPRSPPHSPAHSAGRSWRWSRSPPSPRSELSALSPHYEGDDPDDLEWEPAAERHDRRKPAFR